MLEVDQTWASDGASSGGLTPVFVGVGPLESVFYAQASTLASTVSVAFQTAQSSAGPWFTEGSTAIAATATASAQAVMRFTGPFAWVRPYLNSPSTGTYTFRFVGAS